MGSSALYDKAQAAAVKILGKDAKIPDFPPAVEKAIEGMKKATDEFDKSREDLEAKLVDLQNARDAFKNQIKQFAAKMGKEDFNLDDSDKEAAKKIQQARKIISESLSTGLKNLDGHEKELDEVDKHVIQLGKYKPPKTPL